MWGRSRPVGPADQISTVVLQTSSRVVLWPKSPAIVGRYGMSRSKTQQNSVSYYYRFTFFCFVICISMIYNSNDVQPILKEKTYVAWKGLRSSSHLWLAQLSIVSSYFLYPWGCSMVYGKDKTADCNSQSKWICQSPEEQPSCPSLNEPIAQEFWAAACHNIQDLFHCITKLTNMKKVFLVLIINSWPFFVQSASHHSFCEATIK